MATLELPSSSRTLVLNICSGLTAAAAAAGSMQRTRGMGRGQQRDQPSTDLTHQDSTSNTGAGVGRNTTSRGGGGRNNSKLKVLVRSHAMREETSPPREPTPTPCINLIPSPSPASPERPASPVAMYNHTSPTLHSPTSPRVVLSPRCSPTTNNNSSSTGSPRPTQTTPTAAGSPNHSAANPTVDGCSSAVQLSRSKQNTNESSTEGNNSRYTDTATVRTQDILNSAISRKINGGSASSFAQIAVELNAAVNDEDYDDEIVNAAELSEIYNKTTSTEIGAANVNKTSTVVSETVLNSSLNQKLKPSQTVMNNINNNNTNARTQDSSYIVCDCYKPTCARCTKNNNNNNNNSSGNNNNNVTAQQQQQQPPHSNNTLTVGRASSGKHKLRHQSSSQGSFDGSSSTSPCLSRDNSTEQYTDTTGIDLTQFILETLNKNAKDRVMMLKIEQELVNLAKDKIKTHFKFPPMSSYQRMLVHRCAAYFGMDHNIEISGKCVVVNKTKSTRIPELRFRDHIREDLLFPEEPRRSILKRDSNSFEDCNYKSPDRQFDNRRSKSFEEREEEYEKARRRIFKDGTMQDCVSQEDFNWAEMPWPESECSKIRLLPPEQQSVKQNRLQKVQSVDGKGETTLRPCVAKSFSFGGYGGAVSVLSRGDSVTSTHSAGPRLLTKQDSSTSTISWRLSPSSSGYKSQSQRSDSVTPSPTATPHQLSSDASAKNSVDGTDQHQHSITEETMEQAQQTDKAPGGPAPEGNPLVWAVTDMQSVPKGSVLINPQTGQPFTNQDGSIYHFDPSNPPPGFTTPTNTTTSTPAVNSASKPPPSPPKTITPQRSPVKERSQSPKKPIKSKASPFKNKSSLINSSTSPSLPMTPPAPSNSSTTSSVGYTTSTPLDNTQTMPPHVQQYHQHHPMYPNGYGAPGATDAGGVPVYQQPLGMMYAPYAMPPPYENRPDTSVTDLSGYFVNMALSEPPPCGTQTVGYQTPSGTYWNQQPTTITYYQPPTNQPQQPQRYPVQLPLANQTPGAFVSSNYPAANYVPIPANPTPNTELLPMYPNAPMQMLYQPPTQQNTPNPMYIQNPNPMVYAQNPSLYQQYPNLAYPPTSATPNGAPTNTTYTPPNYGASQNPCFTQQSQNFPHNIATGFDHHRAMNRNTPKNKCPGPKQTSFGPAQAQQGSAQSSNGTNSPANTIITGYFPAGGNAAMNFRQCTPPDTPPNQQHQPQSLSYGYPPNYMQHSVIFRPLGGIRASPPVNMRSSRSPTPGPEYPQVGSVDRNQRYPVGPTVYHSMPCIVPGDMRLVTGRAQPPVYRQPYRQQSSCQSTSDTSNSAGRAHKVRKPRTKVPALPPSGRQSNQSVHTHTPQQRF